MASAAHNGVFGFYGERKSPAASIVRATLEGLGRRLREALERQRRREIDGEICRLIARSGGRLTDSLEREIARRVLTSH